MISDQIAAVIIGRNEGGRLIDCLNSVKSNLQCIVYVDSGSIDGSPQIAEGLGACAIRLNAALPFTAARARNEGFAVVRKIWPNIELIQFIDGDCELDKSWLNIAASFLDQHDDVAVVCGRRRERYPSASVYNRLCDIEWNTPIGRAAACGGDSLVRAEAFEAVGGFRAQLIAGEEPELCVRLQEKGWKIWRLDAEMTRHDAAIMRFTQWWLRTVRGGYSSAEVSLLHWRSKFGIWKKGVASIVFWGFFLPAVIGLCVFMRPIALLVLLIYPLQICRIAIARGPTRSISWAYAFFMTLGKFAGFQGVSKFFLGGIQHKSTKIIEYK